MRRGVAAGLLSALVTFSGLLPAQAALAADPAAASQSTAAAPVPSVASLGPLIFISQTLNNCGPSSVAEVLDYWGIHKTQGEVQATLRADGNPGGMAPFGIPAYARSLGLAALMAPGGTDAVIKALVGNGFPVIVSQWVSLSDHYGHYRPIEAYDDSRGVFVSSDPYLGP
ncbi:MAG TPA: C39 family peptidase, partial [Chloroflexota bacterium]|nr:C39 family peptidase [Chloroflexota bacterium]